MTLSASTNRNDYIGSASTATYSYNFKIFNEDHLRVVLLDSDNDVTVLTKTTDYTVSGVNETSGGSIVLVNNGQAWLDASGYLDSGYKLAIRRVVPVTQETDIRNQGEFYAETHEDQFDKLTMIDQQQDDDLNRSLKLSESVNTSNFSPEIPANFVGAANKSIVTNSNGNGFEVGPSTDEIANAQTYASNAQAAQTASETAQVAAESAQAAAETAQTGAETAQTAAEAAQAAAESAETNAAASETAAAGSETNAATSATAAQNAQTAAETAKTAAELSYTNMQILIADLSSNATIGDSQTNTDISSATIDEVYHVGGVFEYLVLRGSSWQYGKYLFTNQSPFNADQLEKHGDAGVSFDITESAGVGTVNYTSDASGAGQLYYKFSKFEVP